jgi:hypothetical protein
VAYDLVIGCEKKGVHRSGRRLSFTTSPGRVAEVAPSTAFAFGKGEAFSQSRLLA